MNEKKPVLFTVSYLIEAGHDEFDKYQGFLDRITNKLSEDRQMEDSEIGVTPLKWQSTSAIILNPDQNNCGKCAVCDNWVTDVERPEVIEGLNPGTRVNGKLLCDEHLPSDHPGAFNKSSSLDA